MRTRAPAAGLVLFVFVAAACSNGSGEDTAATTGPDCADGLTATDVPYATSPATSAGSTALDVYAPTRAQSDCRAPVVVWVHGGGWRTGDKSNQVADKIALFNEAGYVFVSVNYRLTDTALPDAVVYPAHNEDVGAALGWLFEHADEYGGDAERIAVLGHSAGGAIVAAVATDESYLEAEGIELGTLGCVAPLDTEGFDVAARIAGGGRTAALYSSVFTDPARWTEASPISHVAADKDIPPMLLVERGAPQRRAMLADFVVALEAAEVPATVIDGSGLTHSEVNSQIGASGDSVMTPPLMSFLEDCFAAN